MLSKTVEYALRAVTCLADNKSQDVTPVSADAVAKATRVPRRYLNRVLQDLVAAQIVDSQCGPRGGYGLAKSADQITILDVVDAVAPIERITACPLGLSTHTSLCPLHAAIDEAYAANQAAFAKVTIAAILTSKNPIIALRESE